MLRSTRPLLDAAQRTTITRPAIPRSTALLSGPACPPPFQRCTSLKLNPRIWQTEFSTKPPVQPTKRDVAHEKELAQKKIDAHPELVSTQSTVRHVFEPSQSTQPESRDVLQDTKEDLNRVVDTFALSTVPSQSYVLGLAGTLPYLATSISTVYLSWDLKTGWPTDSNFINSFMVSHETATNWLQALEPIQIGYGAVLISFLGAIHWGLEYAEKSPSRERTRFRYGIGLLAPVLAWPTMMLPIEWALTGQFLTFSGLYLADARATTRGWAPPWYRPYRFVLTAIVGTTIFVTLVARAKIEDKSPRLSSDDLNKIGQHNPETSYKHWARLEAKEMEQARKEKKEKEKKEEKEKKVAEQQKLLEQKGGSSSSKKDQSDDKAQEAEDERAGDENKDEDDADKAEKEEK